MKEANEMTAIIIKNLGQIYLKKTLASSTLMSLLIAVMLYMRSLIVRFQFHHCHA